jgi:hypothetical protein
VGEPSVRSWEYERERKNASDHEAVLGGQFSEAIVTWISLNRRNIDSSAEKHYR